MLKVVKRNKRLIIIDESQSIVYAPPDFLVSRITSRSQLEEVAAQMNETGEVFKAIWDFETSPKMRGKSVKRF